jgi:MoaA/NifB/PqqE/SkfB family radical SAM enzyme
MRKDVILDPQAKLLWHGDKVKRWLESGDPSPVLFEVAPTGFCNAFCPWCFFKDKHKSEQVEPSFLIYFLKQARALGVKAINWTGGGEPTLHPHFNDFVMVAHSLGFKQGLFTNGYRKLHNQELFSWIRISYTDEGFGRIIKPDVPFGICLNQIATQTKDELEDICQEARLFGAKYFQIRPALLGDHKQQPELEVPYYLKKFEQSNFKVLVTEYKYAEAKKERSYDKCFGFNICSALDWNGDIVICLYRQNEDRCVIGNIYHDSLASIFEKYPKYFPIDNKCQNCCKNHQINKSLYDAKTLSRADIDFL